MPREKKDDEKGKKSKRSIKETGIWKKQLLIQLLKKTSEPDYPAATDSCLRYLLWLRKKGDMGQRNKTQVFQAEVLFLRNPQKDETVGPQMISSEQNRIYKI